VFAGKYFDLTRILVLFWVLKYTVGGYSGLDKQLQSSSCPVLGLLRPVMGGTKVNPSIFSKVFLILFSLVF
jgi:hypothetical protein